MVALTLQMHVYWFTDKILMKFQQLNLCFRFPEFQWINGNTVRPHRKWRNPKWWPLEFCNACISASRQDINRIPTAPPRLTFSGFSIPLGFNPRTAGGQLVFLEYLSCQSEFTLEVVDP